jgi:hypothetical protein
MKKFCSSCAILDHRQQVCCLSGRKKNPEVDFCSEHVYSLEHCDKCGTVLLPSQMHINVLDGNVLEILCPKCANLKTSCQNCAKKTECEFETNPDPTPPYIIKTIAQGGMRMQTQVRNPERENKFCKDCSCWIDDVGCCKDYGFGCVNRIEES